MNLNTLLARPAVQKKSLRLFLGLCVVAYGFSLAGVMFFPNQLPGALLARAMLAACGVALLLFGSKMLLRRDGFPADALGLQLTLPHVKRFVLGVAGGLLLIALLAATLAVQVPFHWERGLFSLSHAAFAAHTYFWTSFGEELIFRGICIGRSVLLSGPSKSCLGAGFAIRVISPARDGIGNGSGKNDSDDQCDVNRLQLQLLAHRHAVDGRWPARRAECITSYAYRPGW
jgi:membrane protease YdiL (CAAX protease family)